VTLSDTGILKFAGDLSLENNGGFSSLRTGTVDFDLSDAEGLVARVKGDGRTYQFRLGTDARYRGIEVAFSAEFPTVAGEWTEVRVPFSKFVGSFRGMKLKDEAFDPGETRRLGLLLGDKNAGPFELKVDWIRTYGSDAGSIADQALADGRVKVGEATILEADIEGSNGIIHVIDSVPLPPTPVESNDILSVAKRNGQFGTLLSAIEAAGLSSALEGEGPLTIFAPTDEAFAALPKRVLKQLLRKENREELSEILTYHAIPGRISAGDALNAKSAKTMNGGSVNFAIEEGLLKVNGATILTADIECENGVIHVIDAVLSPPVGGDEATKSKAEPDLSPERRIEAAIEKGVPIFNEGDHAKCAEIYQECLVSLAADERIDAAERTTLEELVERGKEENSDFDRAWLYRLALDRVYANLVNR
jgi:uncharacterized surface protein with fasciclin (FAS1) repeats